MRVRISSVNPFQTIKHKDKNMRNEKVFWRVALYVHNCEGIEAFIVNTDSVDLVNTLVKSCGAYAYEGGDGSAEATKILEMLGEDGKFPGDTTVGPVDLKDPIRGADVNYVVNIGWVL